MTLWNWLKKRSTEVVAAVSHAPRVAEQPRYGKEFSSIHEAVHDKSNTWQPGDPRSFRDFARGKGDGF